MAELKSRGVQFDQDIADQGYGFVTYFTMPGNVKVQLYEPKYQKRSAKLKSAANPARTPTRAKRTRTAAGRGR